MRNSLTGSDVWSWMRDFRALHDGIAVDIASIPLCAILRHMSSASDITHTASIYAIAQAQKGVLACLLAKLLWPLFPPLYVLILPVQFFFVYRLASLTRIGYPPIWVIGTLFPLLDLLLLFLLAKESTDQIRSAGFHVGMTGANLKAIAAADAADKPDIS